MAGLPERQGGGLQHVLCDCLVPDHLGGEPGPLAHGVGRDPEEADGRYREHRQGGDLERLKLQRPDGALVSGAVEHQRRPEECREAGRDIEAAAGALAFQGDP